MKWFYASLLSLVSGYATLALVDHLARNIWGHLSPLLIVAGYVFFGVYLYVSESGAGTTGKEGEA